LSSTLIGDGVFAQGEIVELNHVRDVKIADSPVADLADRHQRIEARERFLQ
jgi:hypothetical protein